MDNPNSLEPIKAHTSEIIGELSACNAFAARFGLVLTEKQLEELVENRFEVLTNTGRIEFGEGILKKLILTFCDSPYMTQENFAETLSELLESFYYFKNESMDRISDDELLEYMKSVFDGRAQGSADYLSGTSLEELCRYAREGYDPSDADSSGDLF